MQVWNSFFHILQTIATTQEHLNTLRQLLNEQIQFNIDDIYNTLSQNTSIDYHNYLEFIKPNQTSKQSIYSIMRFYNRNSSIHLTKVDLPSMLLCRENKLLAKMVKQRQSLGAIPKYIQCFVRKIFIAEVNLHSQLIQFRKIYSKQIKQLTQNLSKSIQLNQLFQLCLQNIQISTINNIKQQNILYFVKRYLNFDVNHNLTNKLINLITQINTNQKVSIKKKKGIKKCRKDPFIHQQFQECLKSPKTLNMLCCRQIKAIQMHLNRVNQVYSEQLQSKINAYRNHLETNVQKVLFALRKIISFERQTQYLKMQVCLRFDFDPKIFYQCFCTDKDNCIIPSSMQKCLQSFGVYCSLQDIYILFKRYTNRTDGKINYKSFKNMFKIAKNNTIFLQKNKINLLKNITIQTKQLFLTFIINTIKNQINIQLIKKQLIQQKNIDLRQVFSCLDYNQDGKLTIQDLYNSWYKFLDLQITNQNLQLLCRRFRIKQKNIIQYENFIAEMLPKSYIKRN